MTYQLNQRVLTKKYGPGTVVGFERFTLEGQSDTPGTEDQCPRNRVLVELDDPTLWPCHTVSQLPPHFMRSDLMDMPVLP